MRFTVYAAVLATLAGCSSNNEPYNAPARSSVAAVAIKGQITSDYATDSSYVFVVHGIAETRDFPDLPVEQKFSIKGAGKEVRGLDAKYNPGDNISVSYRGRLEADRRGALKIRASNVKKQ